MPFLSTMRQFTIRLRMWGAIAAVLGLLALLGGAGLTGMFRITGLAQEFMAHSYTEVQMLSQLKSELGVLRQREKDMIINYEKPEAVRQAQASWNASLEKVSQLGHKMQEGEADPDNAIVQDLLKAVTAYKELFLPVARQLESGGYDTASIANRMSKRAVDQFDQADRLLIKLEESLQLEVDASIAEQAQATLQTKILFAVVVVLALVIVVPLTLLNMVSICRPIEEARHMAERIASGDLSQRIQAEGSDEVADLQRALAVMQDNLGAMVAQVRDASESIATASQEIASGNQDLSQRTEQTASHAQDVVSSLVQLTSTVQQTASSSQMANQLAVSASGTATGGSSVVQQAVASMHEISASSRKINDIIGLIDSIAFQTNILAHNAAVEAARAGEQGRGFAVVAGEVRSLAQRAAAAASEIKTLISSSVAAVDGGVRHVEGAGEAMREIMGSVQRVGDIIGEITAAATEQSGGIGQVNQAVGEIDRMTQQNAALVEQSAAAAESLREQAARLSQLVHQFRLDSSAKRSASRPLLSA